MAIFGVSGARKSDLFDEGQSKGPTYDDSAEGKDQTANRSAYEWGGKEGQATADANDYRNKAMAWRQHQNPWDAQTRGQQLALASSLGSGPQPTAAPALAQQGRDAVMRQALAVGGPNAGAQMQPGTQQATVAGAQLANQELGARDQLYGGLLGQGRAQDINEVGFDAKQNAEMEQFYQRMGYNVAQAQMLAQLAKAKQNVTNWQRFNANELARQDSDYMRTVQQNQLDQQSLAQIGQASGAALGSVAKWSNS